LLNFLPSEPLANNATEARVDDHNQTVRHVVEGEIALGGNEVEVVEDDKKEKTEEYVLEVIDRLHSGFFTCLSCSMKPDANSYFAVTLTSLSFSPLIVLFCRPLLMSPITQHSNLMSSQEKTISSLSGLVFQDSQQTYSGRGMQR
jgi:hypothetical protein